MKEKINSVLLDSWSSIISGIDTIKATDKLNQLFNKFLRIYNNISYRLLTRSLPEIKAYRDMQSNNPNKLQQLNQLIKDIEEQIDNE